MYTLHVQFLSCPSVLGLAGVELTSSQWLTWPVFCICAERVLVMQGHLSCCWAGLTQSQGVFYSSDCPTSEEAGSAQGAGRGQPGQLTRGEPHAIWLKGRRRNGVHSNDICLPKSLLHVTEPCFPEDGWTPGKQWKNSLFCFACMHSLCFTC